MGILNILVTISVRTVTYSISTSRDTGTALFQRINSQSTGSVADGAIQPPLSLQANNLTFARNFSVSDFSLRTETGTIVLNKITDVFTTPGSVKDADSGIPVMGLEAYTSSISVTTSPTI